VRDDDLGDARCVGPRASSPEADGRTRYAPIEIAVDDGYNETSGAYDLWCRRFTTNRRDLRAAERALGGLRSAARSDEPDEQQCDP
jgi:hypothetical protein